ncbi:MAG: tripartite tricarboxylate transporter substrate binding protein [Burkholderiales bacterium]|nr:tripartite tricarboxylate transporter substrate binding protein [Burkholderiales bacterium]
MPTAHPFAAHRVALAAALAGSACLCAGALAQSFPARSIRVVVPFPPGGADVTARIVLPAVQEDLGQPVVVDNRPGAGGIIGSEFVARQPADGYTLLWTANTPIVTIPVTQPKETSYDPLKDFTNISKLLVGVTTASVPSSLPVNTLREFVDYAKRNPGKLSFASVGIGSSQHLDGEVLKLRGGIDMVHVPYKGFGQVLPDLVAGRVQLAFIAYLSAVQQLNAGKLKVLAVTQPYARMPDKPTYEQAIPGFDRVPNWSASMHGPAGLPRAVLVRIYGSLTKVLGPGTPLRKKFEDEGYIVVVSTPEEFAADVRATLAKTAEILKLTGIKVE